MRARTVVLAALVLASVILAPSSEPDAAPAAPRHRFDASMRPRPLSQSRGEPPIRTMDTSAEELRVPPEDDAGAPSIRERSSATSAGPIARPINTSTWR